MSHNDSLLVQPGGELSGRVHVAGDKSISHRAVMFGALADGLSEIHGCLLGEDVIATINAFRAMGVSIEQSKSKVLRVHGVGVDGLKSPSEPLDLGNSGTSMRLLSGILAGANIAAKLTGDASLSKRPMRRVADPLGQMGAHIRPTAAGTPPLEIVPGARLKAHEFNLAIASAQVKSAILLAGLFADGETVVHEPAPTRDHTERMLRQFGVRLEVSGRSVRIAGGQRLKATSIAVPADISSAAFFLVGAAIAPGSQLHLPELGINPTRVGIIEILKLMGASISLMQASELGAEPVAEVRIDHQALHGIDIPEHLVPLAIDEFPVIFIAAACARGITRLRGASELRHKESDRIAVMAEGLGRLGVKVKTFDDGIEIEGGPLGGGEIQAHGDHRIAMAFAIAALRASAPITINGASAIKTSFPDFTKLAIEAGLRLAL